MVLIRTAEGRIWAESIRRAAFRNFFSPPLPLPFGVCKVRARRLVTFFIFCQTIVETNTYVCTRSRTYVGTYYFITRLFFSHFALFFMFSSFRLVEKQQ